MVDKETLYDLHYNQRLSSIKIANLYNVNSKTVRTWFYKQGLELIGNTFQKNSKNPKNSIKTEQQITLLKTINIGREPVNKGSGNIQFTCCVCDKIVEDKPYRKKKYCSKECRENSKGENHWRYKGLENRGNQTKRNWKDYKEFKKQVHIRDNNKCVFCKNNGKEVHHIKSWSKNEELRFDINNAILLCKECHKEVHDKCGRNNYSYEKFLENFDVQI